jgi:2,5-furandicarboxylate decarboxylase 1
VAYRDLRAAVDAFRVDGRLRDVTEPVSIRHEVAAVIAAASRAGSGGGAGALLFTNPSDHTVPIVANMVHSRRVVADAMGVPYDELVERFTERVTAPIGPEAASEAPVLEVAHEDVDLPALMPILTHYDNDAGPYLSTGMANIRNPENGVVERTICRMQLRGRDLIGLALVNPPLGDTYRKHGRDTEMEVAVAVGLEPATFMAAALPAPPGADKMGYAGGLRGEPVEVTDAPLTGLAVPARAEFLLEGVLVPGREQQDGPFGEISGYSMVFSDIPTLQVRRVSHRRDPLYHALLPTGPEGDLITGLTVEAAIAPQLRRVYSFARGITFMPGTFGMSLVVQVAKADKGRVRGLLYHLLSLERIKKVVLVAEDVDPTDPQELEWALVTRVQPDEDVVTIDGVYAHPIDPSYRPGQRTARIGIDATGFERIGGRERARVGSAAASRASEIVGGA